MSLWKNNQKFSLSLYLLLIPLVLISQVACDSKSTTKTEPVAVISTDQDAHGLFTTNGTVTAIFLNPTGVESLVDIKGMVYGTLPTQNFIFFDVASNVLYDGVITAITLTAVTGSADVYHDGVIVASDVAVTGTVTTNSTVSLSFAASGDFNAGTISGLFISPSTIYDEAAINARIFSDGSLADPQWSGVVAMETTGMSTNGFDVGLNDVYIFQAKTLSARCDISGSLVSGNTKNIYILTNDTVDPTQGDPCVLPSATNYSGFTSVTSNTCTVNGTEMWYAITNGENSIFSILTR